MFILDAAHSRLQHCIRVNNEIDARYQSNCVVLDGQIYLFNYFFFSFLFFFTWRNSTAIHVMKPSHKSWSFEFRDSKLTQNPNVEIPRCLKNLDLRSRSFQSFVTIYKHCITPTINNCNYWNLLQISRPKPVVCPIVRYINDMKRKSFVHEQLIQFTMGFI